MQRLRSLDIAKGVAIILVVLFHTVRGYESAGLISGNFGMHVADNAAYAVNVQIFFLVAGYLVFPLTDNLRFQVGRFFTLYYPYITWSVLSWAIAFALSSAVSSPTDVDELLTIPFEPFQHYWFLMALMLSTAALYFTRTPRALLIGSVVALLYSASGLDWAEAGYAFPFMAVGAYLRIKQLDPPADLSMAFFAVAAVLIWSCFAPQFDPANRSIIDMRSPLMIPLSMGGCYAVYAFSTKLEGTRIGETLAMLGEQSMPIYLTHILFGSGTRIVLTYGAPWLDPAVSLVLSLAAGFVGPILVSMLAGRLDMSRISGFEALQVYGNDRPRPMAS